jgi:hypothetical protein
MSAAQFLTFLSFSFAAVIDAQTVMTADAMEQALAAAHPV